MSTNQTPVIDAEVAAKAQAEFARIQRDARKAYAATVKAAKVERDLVIAKACIAFTEAMTPKSADEK